MPELPEVETTLRGIKPHIEKQSVKEIIIRHPKLRWPMPKEITQILPGQTLRTITRRAKYLLLHFDAGTLILHLGMSGRIRILTEPKAPQKHDHLDMVFANQRTLRFTDPRRFGAVLWTNQDPNQHELLSAIGPEPLSSDFDGNYLFTQSRGKKVPVKVFIMNSNVVAGVGNIYATEALFQAQIYPKTPAGKVTAAQYEKLSRAIKNVLNHAIKKGGTTLKDFSASDGSPGYFSIELQVYGREGKSCVRCKSKLKSMRLAQRATVYCPKCQKPR